MYFWGLLLILQKFLTIDIKCPELYFKQENVNWLWAGPVLSRSNKNKKTKTKKAWMEIIKKIYTHMLSIFYT